MKLKLIMVIPLLLTLKVVAQQPLTNSLTVVEIENSDDNQIAADLPNANTCPRGFQGTYSGNTVVFKVRGMGGSGKYSHNIVYTFGDGYKTTRGAAVQFQKSVENNDTFELKLPEIREEIPFIQQSILLVTTDVKSKKTKTTNLMFNVTRPVILLRSMDPLKSAGTCRQTFPAIESVTGILSNGSANPSELLIKHGIQSIWDRTTGSQHGFGIFVSPLAWTWLGNIFSLSYQRNYFKQFTKQTVETVEISTGHQIAPGDFIQIYEQRTRYVTPFDVIKVSVCGYQKQLDDSYYMQWWGVAYHAMAINPESTVRTPVETIGARPLNTCPANLTPSFLIDDPSKLKFVRTN